MKSKLVVALGVISLFVISMSVFAHHGTQVSYDMNKAVDVKGVVTKFAWLNPHSQLYFDVKDKNGTVVKIYKTVKPAEHPEEVLKYIEENVEKK